MDVLVKECGCGRQDAGCLQNTDGHEDSEEEEDRRHIDARDDFGEALFA